jgi:hypothetical protein
VKDDSGIGQAVRPCVRESSCPCRQPRERPRRLERRDRAIRKHRARVRSGGFQVRRRWLAALAHDVERNPIALAQRLQPGGLNGGESAGSATGRARRPPACAARTGARASAKRCQSSTVVARSGFIMRRIAPPKWGLSTSF